ncbi:Bud site selection protein, Revert to axial protein 1 [Exophiala xenobiotica]|nr:Bud site selection protein, Revert to axial protein 1 [Exophiala xenobiotica]KAK5398372.1 Bud site selection protein, Revert to axial protein 1 [Exophiala xenobiotica]KAK5417558.1 Bud site selection protein, Revert to axial protein 1 [Exophiala xenobiotica]KAK5464015.1 Bud site selection protein, Revert to axial protein 1 [Exophiala xenobiotica]KAK5497776.1 Bud site selection protein, Revert to axial protein 1 [Exophiala xenobiotica]
MAHHTNPEQELEQRKRLPTLMEVLGRRTLAPVDLFSFYIYMRDQQRSVDYLDFWLDVSQHMSLCRHYVRELRRSMLVDTPEMEKATSKRSSALLGDFDIGEGLDTRKSGQESRVSAILRGDNGNRNKPGSRGREAGLEHSPSHSLGSSHSRNYSRPSQGDRPSPSEQLPQPSYSTPEVRTDSNSPGHSVARADIKASAEKILYTFVLPGSEREIVLPDTMLNKIIRAIEEEGRDDPEVFDDAKDYVFQAMERDAFPGFLQAKALGNLVPLSVLIRLIIGLASLMAGFWGGYYMILRNISRSTRCWLILPFVIGAYFLVSYQYKLDIATAYAGYSEYTWMNWSRVREPFVRRLLLTRATMAFFMFAAVAVGLSVLFIFVPGTNF